MSTAPVSYASTEVQSNATLTASGSYTSNPINVAGSSHIEVFVVVTGTVSGTSPSLVVSAIPLEAGSNTGMATYSSTAITATNGAQVILLDTAATNNIIGDSLKISWTITGTSPSFGGVYIRVIQKQR